MRQSRYTTESQLLKAIDRTIAFRKKAADKIAHHHKQADYLFGLMKLADPAKMIPEVYERYLLAQQDAKNHRNEADRLSEYYPRYKQRLKRLKRTLAAFRTRPMPFVDETVVMQ